MVTDEYLDKLRFAVRRAAGSPDVDAELRDLAEAARADMVGKGVLAEIAADESDPQVLGALRCFVRWQFGIGGDDADRNRDSYELMVEQLRKQLTEV